MREGHDDRDNVGIAIDGDDNDSVEQTFVTEKGESREVGSTFGLSESQCGESRKLVSTSSLRDLLLLPSGMARKRIFASTESVCSPLGQIQFNT